METVVMTKTILKNVKLIGQIDSKFIATWVIIDENRYLILFDQHAVDERVRLEHLQNEFSRELSILKRTKLEAPLRIFMPMNAHKHLTLDHLAIENVLNMSGISCSVRNIGEVLTVDIVEMPIILLSKLLRKKQHEDCLEYVKSSVSKTVTSILDGNVLASPNLFAEIMAAEACSRAIKFGVHMNDKQMTNLLERLRQCSLPFQCAHGRPTVAVIPLK